MLAGYFGLSERQFRRGVIEATGRTPNKQILEIRLQLAQALKQKNQQENDLLYWKTELGIANFHYFEKKYLERFGEGLL